MSNISCMISRTTISSGDLVYAIPLKKNDKRAVDKNRRDGMNNYCMYEPNEMFTPLCLPVLVKYLSVNKVNAVNLDRDAVNIAHIESMFLLDIGLILAPEGSFEAMGYVHKEIFEAMCTYYNDYDGSEILNWDFERSYDILHEQITTSLQTCRDNIITYETDLIDTEDEYTRLDIQKQIINEKMAILKHTELFDFTCIDGFHRNEGIIHEYFPEIKDGELKFELVQLFQFHCNLSAVNCHFTPTVHGMQHGNQFMTRRLLDIATKINDSKFPESD